MDCHEIHSAVAYLIYVILRVYDHQMGVERFPRIAANGLYYREAVGNIGHEDSVHDVKVHP